MNERFINFIIILSFILFLVLGAVLFITNVDWSLSPRTPGDKIITFGTGIGICGALVLSLLYFLLRLGEKTMSKLGASNFLEKPLVKKTKEKLERIGDLILKICFLAWVITGFYWLLRNIFLGY